MFRLLKYKYTDMFVKEMFHSLNLICRGIPRWQEVARDKAVTLAP